jgi:hypothetical protein
MFRTLIVRLCAALGLSLFTIRIGTLLIEGGWAASWNSHSTLWLAQFLCALMTAAVAWFGRCSAVWGSNRQEKPFDQAVGIEQDDGQRKTGQESYGFAGRTKKRSNSPSYLPANLQEKMRIDEVANEKGMDKICEMAVFLFLVGQALLLLAGCRSCSTLPLPASIPAYENASRTYVVPPQISWESCTSEKRANRRKS